MYTFIIFFYHHCSFSLIGFSILGFTETAMQQVVEEVEASFGVDGICEDYDFDLSAPPPFKIGDIRAAIPKLARSGIHGGL